MRLCRGEALEFELPAADTPLSSISMEVYDECACTHCTSDVRLLFCCTNADCWLWLRASRDRGGEETDDFIGGCVFPLAAFVDAGEEWTQHPCTRVLRDRMPTAEPEPEPEPEEEEEEEEESFVEEMENPLAVAGALKWEAKREARKKATEA